MKDKLSKFEKLLIELTKNQDAIVKKMKILEDTVESLKRANTEIQKLIKSKPKT